MKYTYPVMFGVLVFVVGVFVSGLFGWYVLIPHIDKVFHFSGGLALGWFFCLFLGVRNLPIASWKKILIVVSATCFVAVCWEYAERLSSLYAPHYAPWLYHWFNGGDLDDTLLDILAGMMGGLVFSSIYILI